MVSKVEHKTRSGCPVACALDIIGDHWTLLIIRNLMFLGLHEYKDMLEAPEKISSSVLSDRLKKLETQGVISSVDHPDSKRRKLYYLTEMGRDLVHIIVPMIYWADKHLHNQLLIPEDKRSMMQAGSETVIKQILEYMDAWEKKHVL